MLSLASRRLSLIWFTVLTLTAVACAPQASKTENPSSARAGGSGGSQPGSTGAGGSGAAGSGSGTAGGPGASGPAGSSGTTDGGAPQIVAGPVIPLPMVVTNNYQNQGWFGDPSLQQAISSGTLIQQGDAVTGPCATRAPAARGKCLKIVYTPPAGITPPAMGGWVGVFFLTTILQADPNATPPLKIGDANWGAQPGKNVAPGATKISFQAASASDGLSVTFKAGVDPPADNFVLPDQIEVLGTSWKSLSIPLSGAIYGTNLIGAFAWVLKDTTKPATFYLDNIVWE